MSDASRARASASRGSGESAWVSAALLIAGVTIVARVVGFLRYVILARTVDTECLGSVYATANAVPNIIYEVVVGGALVAVVVPLVAGAREKDPANVRAMVAALHGWSLALLIPVTALMYLVSTLVIQILMGSGGSCGRQAPTVARDMLWVFLLQIPVYGATVIAQGSLQAHHRFFAPAVAPALSSVVVIGSYLWYAQLAGAEGGSLSALTDNEFWILAGGTTIGVFTLLLVQVPALLRAGLIVRPSLTFPDGRTGQARTLAWSGAVVVGVQWVGYAAAIRWSNVYGSGGSALVFVLGWTLFLLPWSILVLPIATSTFPRLSSLHERGERTAAAETIAQSTRAVIVASTVGAAGLFIAAVPLAVVTLGGNRGATDVDELAALLTGLSVGVFAYGVHGHLVRVLAARHQAPSAAWGTALGWACGVSAAWLLVLQGEGPQQVARAIGVGFSIGLVVAAGVLTVSLIRHAGGQALAGVLRVGLAAGGAGVVVALVGRQWIGDRPTTAGTAVLEVLVVGVAVVLVVGGVAALTDPGVVRTLARMRVRAKGDA